MLKKFMYIFFIISLLIFTSPSTQAEESKNVFILNSYHRGFEWTDSITRAFIRHYELNKDVNVLVEYMDWKNFPTQENLDHVFDEIKYKYKSTKIDLLITTDDAALAFAIDHRDELFKNAPIIFTGVNEKNANELTKGVKDITGIIEKQDVINTYRLAKDLNSKIDTIYVLYEDTESGNSMGEEAISDLKAYNPKLKVIYNNETTFEGIIKEINGLPKNSAVFVSTFYTDSEGEIHGFSQSLEYIIKNSNEEMPFFILYDFYLGVGSLGGSLLSGGNIGNQALGISEEVLNGKDINTISFTTMNAFRLALEYPVVKKFDFKTDKLQEEFELFNKPPSLMDDYSRTVYSVIFFFILLLLFIIFQFYNIEKLVFLKRALEEKNEELTASEEEMYAQYEELVITLDKLQDTQKELSDLAYNDTITGLGNRTYLNLYYNEILRKNKKGAILLADIDDFKHINDAYGHIFGDKLIGIVAEKIKEIIYDEKIKAFRLGGDEYLIVITDTSDYEIEEFAQGIINNFKYPVLVNDYLVKVSFSIGLAFFPADGITLNDLMRKADMAMYRAKELGKGRYVCFTKSMLEALNKRRRIEKNLDKAIENNELSVHYQPQLSTKDNGTWGFEALLRWNSKELGNVPPLDFISIAEENQLIVPIGDFVLEEACRFIKNLQDKHIKQFVIAVNISVVQILRDDFVSKILTLVEKHNLPPNSLEIEITESIMIESFEIIFNKLKELKGRGIKIALDDFGIGYSSLNYIKMLPITSLKIDKAFIDEVNYGRKERDLVGAIIQIGKLMELEVIAEGVETKEQLEYLTDHKVNRIQGYYFSKPLPEEEVYKFIEEDFNGEV